MKLTTLFGEHYYWVPLWSQIVGFGGLVLSIIFTSSSLKDTNAAFTELHLTIKIPTYLEAMIITLPILYFVALISLLLPSTWRYKVEKRGNQKSARSFLMITAGLNSFAWVIKVLFIICIIIATLWLVGLVAANEASIQSIQYIEPVWNKLSGFYYNTIDVVDNFNNITNVDNIVLDKLGSLPIPKPIEGLVQGVILRPTKNVTLF